MKVRAKVTTSLWLTKKKIKGFTSTMYNMSSCGSSSELSSSWINEPEKTNMITFDLPATDFELVQQVFDFIEENPEVNRGDILIRMARKYRFAGYIGTLEFLSAEVRELKETIRELKETIRELKQEIQTFHEVKLELKNPTLDNTSAILLTYTATLIATGWWINFLLN